ncbi:MAG: hypothetical protein CL530_00760 [Aequorivita sp.]|nr:hypothetical protein [Aequorivita sp.]|tara:strand:- start:3165 stop:4103 length:939 start_codon:yes stop_codon:yes gene_type:complete
MNKMPPFKVFIIIWGVLLGYLTLNFISRANINFIQFNYDWEHIVLLNNFKGIKIDSVSNDYLSIQNDFQVPTTLNTNNTFLLKNKKDIYFRTSEILKDSNHIVFSGVKWINSIPNKKDKIGELKIINLPLIQPEGKLTMTIGDSQIIWRRGRDLRKNLAQKGSFYFVGNKLDVYGYPYVGGTFDKTTDLITKIKKARPAEYYILFFGAQDKNLDITKIKNDTCEILRLLQNKTETKMIYLITLPPSTNKNFISYNKEFNKNLIDCSKLYNKTKIIDFFDFLNDKSDYLAEDEVHLNEKGYLFLNKLLLKEIN